MVYAADIGGIIISSLNMEKIFTAFPEQNPNPVFCVSPDGAILYCNHVSKVLFKEWCYEQGESVPGKVAAAVRDPHMHGSVEITTGGRLYTFTVVPVSGESAVFFYGNDITEHRATEERLEHFSRIIEESINIVFITDFDGKIEYVNRMFEKITGYRREETVGKNPRILASGETTTAQYKVLWDSIKSGKTWRGLFKNRKKNGGIYYANGFITPIRNGQSGITHFLAIQEDITEKIAAEERLRYLKEYDRITGIINRAYFVELLESNLSDLKMLGDSAVLLQINIDDFKLINDSYGYSVGDQFLKNFADFLKDQVKELDIVYAPPRKTIIGRLGEDEFALFLFARNEREGRNAAETIRQAVERHRFLNGMIRITVSIGIALFPEHGTTCTELLSRSSAATVHAKEQGKNRYSLYRADINYLKQAHAILEEKQRIIVAMEKDLFIPWFQPILHLLSREIHHYEALARLMTPDGTLLPPSSFIPTAERYGLISDIDRIITEKTIKKQAELLRAGIIISFSMNLSGKHLGDAKMLRFLQTVISESGANPDCLIFEITETAAIQNMSSAVAFVKALKEMGCKFSLDDFGVGFTSFVHLVEMKVDFLKIDGSFVRRLPESKRDRILVKTIADMARSLNIKTIAEFVDRKEIIPLLHEFGIDYAQGYFIGKPSPLFSDKI